MQLNVTVWPSFESQSRLGNGGASTSLEAVRSTTNPPPRERIVKSRPSAYWTSTKDFAPGPGRGRSGAGGLRTGPLPRGGCRPRTEGRGSARTPSRKCPPSSRKRPTVAHGHGDGCGIRRKVLPDPQWPPGRFRRCSVALERTALASPK